MSQVCARRLKNLTECIFFDFNAVAFNFLGCTRASIVLGKLLIKQLNKVIEESKFGSNFSFRNILI